MLETYKAVLPSDKIEWNADAPKTLTDDKPVEVFITISENSKDTKARP